MIIYSLDNSSLSGFKIPLSAADSEKILNIGRIVADNPDAVEMDIIKKLFDLLSKNGVYFSTKRGDKR
jgi:hypothetical protein